MKKPKKKGGLRTFRYRGCTVTVWWARAKQRPCWYFAAAIPGRPRLLMTDLSLERGRRSILQDVDAGLAVLASRVALLQGWMDSPALGDAFERRTTAQVVEALGGDRINTPLGWPMVVNDAVPADMVVFTTRLGSFIESIMQRAKAAVVAVGLVDPASLRDPNTVVMDSGDKDVTVTHPEGRS